MRRGRDGSYRAFKAIVRSADFILTLRSRIFFSPRVSVACTEKAAQADGGKVKRPVKGEKGGGLGLGLEQFTEW